jgi:polar amino acid transport system substrate-binding protein
MTARIRSTRTLVLSATLLAAAVTLAACASPTTAAEETTAPDGGTAAVVDESLAELLPADIRDSGVVKVGSPYSLKPSIFTDDAGAPQGISVDLSEALGEVLGVEFEWEEAADPVTALQSGAIDVSIGYLSDSPAREEVLTMVPQFLNTSTLLVPADSEVAEIESMCGEVLAVVSGSQQEKSATAISDAECAADPIEITSFPGAKDAITQVQSGRAAAFVAPRMILEGVVESSAGAFAVTDADYTDFPFAMGVTTDNADFAEALAGALQVLFDNGTYADILAEWDVSDIALSADQIGVNTGSTAAFPVNQ